MQYPEYSQHARSNAPIDAIVDDIAWREREERQPTHYSGSSDFLGQHSLAELCLNMSDQRRYPDNRVQPPHAADQARWRIGNALTELILAQNANRRLVSQRMVHTQVIAAIKTSINAKNRLARGDLAEFTTLGMFTRLADPRVVAYLAPQHQDRNADIGGHYDVGVAFAEVNGDVHSHYLQIKSMCFGRCATPSEDPQLVASTLRKYRPLIQLVSACCDLGMKPYAVGKTTVPHVLQDEYQGTITPNSQRWLDDIGNALIFNVSAGLLPVGTRPTSSINIDHTILSS